MLNNFDMEILESLEVSNNSLELINKNLNNFNVVTRNDINKIRVLVTSIKGIVNMIIANVDESNSKIIEYAKIILDKINITRRHIKHIINKIQ